MYTCEWSAQLPPAPESSTSISHLDPISVQLDVLVSAVTGFGAMFWSAITVQQAENQLKITSASLSSFHYAAKAGVLIFSDNVYKGGDLTKIPMNDEKWHWCCSCVDDM